MSLSFEDLEHIRQIMREEIGPVKDTVEALENDIKELYSMVKP